MANTVAFGHFVDTQRQYVITDPLPARPWINYLGNRRLNAFISQNAGGMLWFHEAQTRRISRYHYIAAPQDRPGFYVYVKDRRTGTLWNPHLAPTLTKLDQFACCHEPGLTRFTAARDNIAVSVDYFIPPQDDVMLWRVQVRNVGTAPADLQLCSYIEFGLLEYMRELWWCYLKNHIGFTFDRALQAVRYDYHAFEAPFTPRMLFACTQQVSGFDCSRDVFIGRGGSLERPEALTTSRGLTGSEIPSGGHGCGALAVDLTLAPGQEQSFGYVFAIADQWSQAETLVKKYQGAGEIDRALASTRTAWLSRLDTLQARTSDAEVDRFVNTWNPYNCYVTLELARSTSADHIGLDGLRFRDTTQDALAVAHLEPEFALDRMRMVLGQQKRDGSGCMTFYPHAPTKTTDAPHRSDNPVWPVYTMHHLIAETGDAAVLREALPYRDGGSASVYEHLMVGLRHVYDRRGSHGLPMMFDADWNDGLALFGDTKAESVMLGMQLVLACRQMSELAKRWGDASDAQWCSRVADELTGILNSDVAWDGRWYRRLLLSNGKHLGGSHCRQGSIFLEPQVWAVLSGVGAANQRGASAMDAVAESLDTDAGIRILHPPFTGIPEPEDPPLGSAPGTNENGAVFCHANTWAIIAEAMLHRPERAWKYYRQLLPTRLIERFGIERYGREPYVYVSTITGPSASTFGQAGISWLSGTASWMYVAATQFLLGIRPMLDGLEIAPCLPRDMKHVRVTRRYRGCVYEIDIEHAGKKAISLQVDGQPRAGSCIVPVKAQRCAVRCQC